jgi:hypothetical protein
MHEDQKLSLLAFELFDNIIVNIKRRTNYFIIIAEKILILVALKN